MKMDKQAIETRRCTNKMSWNEKVRTGKVARKLTSKVTEDSESLLEKVVLALGTAAWIMHDNDSHMFRLSESPTNIIFFPLHLLKKSAPLNLHQKEEESISILPCKRDSMRETSEVNDSSTLVSYKNQVAKSIWDTGYHACHIFGN